MADQTSEPGSGDVADERGEVTPSEMPGHAVIAPDAGIDAPATHESSGLTPSGRRTGTQGAATEDLADPEADANRPDPSKPISISAGPQRQPDRGRDIPGGGYGDSRDTPESRRAIDDEGAGIRSGSRVTEDDMKGRAPRAEHPDVGQPANVSRPRRP